MTGTETLSHPPNNEVAGLLNGYRGAAGHWDEAVGPDGAVRPHWQKPLAALLSQTPAVAQDQQDQCRRLLNEYGVTYNSPGRDEQRERPWQLDSWPLVLPAGEWESLSRAVAQRARLLNLILADIYGPQRLLYSGDLPPEIVLANPAFLRAAANIIPPRGIFLSVYAADVARSPDGRWWVVNDRADTPNGAGYALENRIVLRRVHSGLIRDCMVERLAGFFQSLRESLLERAKPHGEEPRVVILTPGPYHATYFEQVYLARYLGFALVEGGDLTVRDQGVFLKTLSGLAPVDVILRRIDSPLCDPLELRDDSLLGVPGLLQAARAGKVVLANTIGVGVVETPALLPFLPGLCRRMLAEELLMPPVATWWCGQEEALQTVLQGLDRLVVKHAYPTQEFDFLPGKHPRGELKSRLLADPHLYVGQECVALSTAPTWQDRRLQPQHLMMRVYAAARGDGEYVVMPGGLTRADSSPESILLSAQTRGGSKDTWILRDSPPEPTTLLATTAHSSAVTRAGFILPSRLADNLFWLGRYVERIEFGCRLVRCLLHRLTDETEQAQLSALTFLLDMLDAHGRIPESKETETKELESEESAASDASPATFQELLQRSVFEDKNPDSIAADINKVQRIATAVRDRLSHDAWRILRTLREGFSPNAPTADLDSRWADARLAAIDSTLAELSAFTGQAMDGMTRDKGWRFLDLGRRLERAADLCDLIRHAMLVPGPEEGARLQALLEIANSAMTYRSRYVFGPEPAPLLDLLLADESNPRSVAFQIAALYRHVRALRPKAERLHKALEQKIVLAIFAEIRLVDVDALVVLRRRGRRARLALLLKRITRAMERLSRTLTRSYLTHVQTARPLGRAGE